MTEKCMLSIDNIKIQLNEILFILNNLDFNNKLHQNNNFNPTQKIIQDSTLQQNNEINNISNNIKNSTAHTFHSDDPYVEISLMDLDNQLSKKSNI
jgi:hypothetical protein